MSTVVGAWVRDAMGIHTRQARTATGWRPVAAVLLCRGVWHWVALSPATGELLSRSTAPSLTEALEAADTALLADPGNDLDLCPGEGECHGCRDWCDWCGESRSCPGPCDTHHPV